MQDKDFMKVDTDFMKVVDSTINTTNKIEAERPTEQKKSITELLTEVRPDLEKYSYVTLVNMDIFKFFDTTMRNEQDFEKGNWHYIPRSVNEEYRQEHDNKSICVEIYCINDKTILRRLTKLIKRYSSGKKVEWEKH